MNPKIRIASGVSVLITTLAFGHIMIHDTQHLLRDHESTAFVVGHSIVAMVLGVLSLAGGFCLLTGKVRQKAH